MALKRIRDAVLRAGYRLPGDLHDASGRILAEAGTCLSEEDVAEITPCAGDGLFSDTDWPEILENQTAPMGTDDTMGSEGGPGDLPGSGEGRDEHFVLENKEVDIDSLRAGMRLVPDLYDENDVLLLASGTEITPRFLQLLGKYSIKTVNLRHAKLEALQASKEPPKEPATEESRELDAFLVKELREPVSLNPVHTARRPRLSLERLRDLAVDGLEKHTAASNTLSEIYTDLQRGRRVSHGVVHDTIRGFVDLVTLDFDLLPLIVSMRETRDEFLFDHCVDAALLSISLSAQLGLNREQTAEVGTGALLQDIGMLRVPRHIRQATRALTPEEWAEIRRHPLHTLECLEGMQGLPTSTKFIAYQSHERGDRSGYPRQHSGMYLHQFAKIVSVADAYSAMSGTRPHRKAMLPYEAAKMILVESGQDKYDRTIVRAFLDAVSLFPIGSLVELDSGMKGKVVRANPGLHTRPVIEEVNTDSAAVEPTGRIIDLSQHSNLKVVRVLTPHNLHV